jgi:hypothetical protein
VQALVLYGNRKSMTIAKSLAGLALISFAFAGAVACSGTPSLSEEEYCTKSVARQSRCSPGTPVLGRDQCGTRYRCLSNAYDASFLDVSFACQTKEACGGNCGDEAIAQAGKRQEEADKCTARYTACKDTKDRFDGDVCRELRGLKSDPADAVIECLEKPCEQIKDCIKGAYASRGISDCTDD